MGSVLLSLYFFFAGWWRRLGQQRKAAAPAGPGLPLYHPGLTGGAAGAPEEEPPDAAGGGVAAEALPEALSPLLQTLSPSKLKMLLRVEDYCRRFGVCTASSETLAADWNGPGRHCTPKHARRLLLELARDGYIDGWFEPRLCTRKNPVGRALRVSAPPPPHRQLELRLGQRRRATPEELARGFPAARPPVERRKVSTPEQGSGGHLLRTPVSAGHVQAGGADMSTDPRSEIRTPKEAVNETGPGLAAPDVRSARPGIGAEASPAQLARGGATGGATDAVAERLRRHAVEMRRRRDIGALRLFQELHEGAQTCAKCKALDAQPEHRIVQGQRTPVGWLFPSVEAADDAARGHVPLHADPEEDEADEEDGEEEAALSPEEVAAAALRLIQARHAGTGPPRPRSAAAAELWAQLRNRIEPVLGETERTLFVDRIAAVDLVESDLLLWAPDPGIQAAVMARWGSRLLDELQVAPQGRERFESGAGPAPPPRSFRWTFPEATGGPS